jgi:hypothetical protein
MTPLLDLHAIGVRDQGQADGGRDSEAIMRARSAAQRSLHVATGTAPVSQPRNRFVASSAPGVPVPLGRRAAPRGELRRRPRAPASWSDAVQVFGVADTRIQLIRVDAELVGRDPTPVGPYIIVRARTPGLSNRPRDQVGQLAKRVGELDLRWRKLHAKVSLHTRHVPRNVQALVKANESAKGIEDRVGQRHGEITAILLARGPANIPG